MNDGAAVHAIVGDGEGRHIGEPVAHTKTVTALFYYDDLIFSGSADCSVRVWDAKTYACKLWLVGHTGTVWCVTADASAIFSGSADTTVRIWHCDTGECLRVVKAHNRTVNCICVAGDAMLTGSADFDIKVWTIKEGKVNKQQLDFDHIACTERLVGQKCAVTALSFSSSDVVSGGDDGFIVVWNGGEILQRFQAHPSTVRCIQFDSGIVISGGVGGEIAIHNIVTGETITTYRDHKKHILALQFDNEKIISCDGQDIITHMT
jgi:F-box and WD-40 domain protein CDC4